MTEILNLQPRNGQAKVYQVKQVREIIVSYGLAEEPESDPPADEDVSGEEAGPATSEGNHDQP